MMGYYKDPKATEEARKFGWHHTGDLALIDEHGEVLFLDRKKDMIKSGGENVASVKIEETLLAHPAVQNAAVVGLPHPQWGEAVSAFVKLKPGAQRRRGRHHRSIAASISAASRCRNWSGSSTKCR